ncbi:DUF3859 domain-containing protein [Caldimonas sp. KR1-144]|uniref:DUF3859 domain-containing protein n=1 Tax=Caldimonas sp. KR1-144 TaxID=3400911 RepID=UPI003C10A8D3
MSQRGLGLRVVAAVATTALIAGCAAPVSKEISWVKRPGSASKVDVVWTGTYEAASGKVHQDVNSLGGKHTTFESYRKTATTTNIPLTLGTRFGVAYSCPDLGPDEYIEVRRLWTFADPGLKDPRNGRLAIAIANTAPCTRDETMSGYHLGEPWELVPGLWKFELQVDGQTVQTVSFELQPPTPSGSGVRRPEGSAERKQDVFERRLAELKLLAKTLEARQTAAVESLNIDEVANPKALLTEEGISRLRAMLARLREINGQGMGMVDELAAHATQLFVHAPREGKWRAAEALTQRFFADVKDIGTRATASLEQALDRISSFADWVHLHRDRFHVVDGVLNHDLGPDEQEEFDELVNGVQVSIDELQAAVDELTSAQNDYLRRLEVLDGKPMDVKAVADSAKIWMPRPRQPS